MREFDFDYDTEQRDKYWRCGFLGVQEFEVGNDVPQDEAWR